jgi:hypothetical protein
MATEQCPVVLIRHCHSSTLGWMNKPLGPSMTAVWEPTRTYSWHSCTGDLESAQNGIRYDITGAENISLVITFAIKHNAETTKKLLESQSTTQQWRHDWVLSAGLSVRNSARNFTQDLIVYTGRKSVLKTNATGSHPFVVTVNNHRQNLSMSTPPSLRTGLTKLSMDLFTHF